MSVSPRVQVLRSAAEDATFIPRDYLTDGRRLFRVVSRFEPRAAHVSAVLEDCLTLVVEEFTPDELDAMTLRRVPVEAS
jgi:hypothetical protein